MSHSITARAARPALWLPVALLGVVLLGLGPAVVRAQSASVSYSSWSLQGQRVTLRFLLPIDEAHRVTGTDIDVLTSSRFADYLLAHVAVTAAGVPCPAIDQGYDLGKVDPLTVGSGLDGFEIFFQCERPQELVLIDHALFDRLPGQLNFARLQINGSPFAQQLFTAGRQRLRLPMRAPLASAGVASYVAPGARHWLASPDRWCFLLGAVLLAAALRPLAAVLAGLAGGYALSLPLSLSAGITPRAPLVEAFVGFLVALLAAQLLARHLRRGVLAALFAGGVLLALALLAGLSHAPWPTWLLVGAALFAAGYLAAQRPPLPLAGGTVLLAVLLGCLDGCLLPGQLLPLQLTAATEWPMLLGFDIGALLAAAALLAGLCLIGTLAPRLRWTSRATLRGLVRDLVTAGLGGLGVFWLLNGLHAG